MILSLRRPSVRKSYKELNEAKEQIENSIEQMEEEVEK